MENISEFINAIKHSNQNSFSFGNGILYDMCKKDFKNFFLPLHLADKIWLIGRSYSASPERRSYNKAHKLKTSADGTGQFFQAISQNICQSTEYKDLHKILGDLQNGYNYDLSQKDINKLALSIKAVYIFNKLIRCATEKFDGVADPHVHCKNQISFSSKFLHFHCPQTIYIIDQYSLKGGTQLYNFNKNKKLSFAENVLISKETIEIFNRDYSSNELKELLLKTIDIKLGNESEDKRTEEKIKNYISHVARGYMISKFMKDNKICPNPRLIDNVFLRIKQTNN